MEVHISDIIECLEAKAPPQLAEKWDNVGLLTGERNSVVKRIMTALDVTADVLNEALDTNTDLIITHHPVIFRPLKSISDSSPKGSLLITAIKNNISIYSMHTNYDTARSGLNAVLAKLLGLRNIKGLNTGFRNLYKIAVYVPPDYADAIKKVMSDNGCGYIGNYSDCTFSVNGSGTFRPLDGSNPFKGINGELVSTEECRIESIISRAGLSGAVSAIIKAHPYEEPAFDIYKLEMDNPFHMMGAVGNLEKEMSVDQFIGHVIDKLDTESVMLAGSSNGIIRKAAVFCGAFDGNTSGLIREKPDIFVTGEIKYNQAVDLTECGMRIIQAGHFHTEKPMLEAVAMLLRQAFKGVEVFTGTSSKDVFKPYFRKN